MGKSNLLINEPPLTVLPTLATVVGLNQAIVLQQLHYWATNPKVGVQRDGYTWVYNTYEQWQAENFPFWSVNTVQRTFAALEKAGLVVAAQFDLQDWNHRKYYRIDYDALQAAGAPQVGTAEDTNLVPPENTKLVPPLKGITETTTETTGRQRPTRRAVSVPVWDVLFGGGEPTEADKERIALEAAYTDIANRLSAGLHLGAFPQSTKAQAVYRWIYRQEQAGQSLDRFIEWVMRDERSATYAFTYHKDPDTIKRDWPRAHPAPTPDTPQQGGAFYG